MEEEKKLYPFKLCSIADTYGWGDDEFLLADLGYRDSLVRDGWLAGNSMSEVMDTYMDRVVGEKTFEYFGRQFPFQVKRIRVRTRTPLVVHPGDDTASQRYDFLGREKLWYIASAGKDARLYLGWKETTDAGAVYAASCENALEPLLNVQIPHAGDFFHIKPGTVHAASGDITVIEVSESSPLDFCIHNWGEAPEAEEFDESLGLVEALDFIDYNAYANDIPAAAQQETVRKVLDLHQFTASTVSLTTPLRISAEGCDAATVYCCLCGEASLQVSLPGINGVYTIKSGEAILVPAECGEFILAPLAPATTLLEITVQPKPESI